LGQTTSINIIFVDGVYIFPFSFFNLVKEGSNSFIGGIMGPTWNWIEDNMVWIVRGIKPRK